MAVYFGSGSSRHPNQGYVVHEPYKGPSFATTNFPASVQTQVRAINDMGYTAGFWVDAQGNKQGFVDWADSFQGFSDPHTPNTSGSVNQLLGINNKGVPVRFYMDASGKAHAYTLNQNTGVFTPLGITIPGVSTVATGINNDGQ